MKKGLLRQVVELEMLLVAGICLFFGSIRSRKEGAQSSC